MLNDPRTVTPDDDVAFDTERHLYFAPGGEMDDRELLEKAARAAGVEVKTVIGDTFWLADGVTWNPLTDDADRYRLARQLGISIDFEDCCAWKRLASGRLIQEFWGGDCGTEAHAVVRAAAAMCH